MARNLQDQQFDEEFQDYHPHGCMWGILHILNSHHRHNVKRMLQHKKHRSRVKHARCCRKPQTISLHRDTGEVQELPDTEEDYLLFGEHLAKSNPLKKGSEKTQISSAFRHRIFGFHLRSQLHKPDSVQHLEHSNYRHGEKGLTLTKPIILLHKTVDSTTGSPLSSLPKFPEDSLEHCQNSSKTVVFQENINKATDASINQQPKEHEDVLEVFKVNKELFEKIIQDPDSVTSKHSLIQKNSPRDVKLTKSGSFPVADPSRFKHFKPATLEHKQSESWSFPKEEKLLNFTQMPNFGASKSRREDHISAFALMTDDSIDSGGKHVTNGVKQETNFSSHGISRMHNNQRWNQSIVNYFKDVKKRVKHALKDISTTSGRDGADDSRSFHDKDSHDHYLSNGLSHSIRRTSLNESMDRFARLLEHSFDREAKWHHSRSLKLTNEDKIPSRGRAPKFFGRISSLPEFESFCSFLNEVSRDFSFPEEPNMSDTICKTNTQGAGLTELNSIGLERNQSEPQNAAIYSDFEEQMVEEIETILHMEYSTNIMVDKNDEEIHSTGDPSEDRAEAVTGESSSPQEQEADIAMIASEMPVQSSSTSVVETCFPDDMMSPEDLPISEGLNSRCLHEDEPTSSTSESLPVFHRSTDNENTQQASEEVKNAVLPFETYENACFSYVRDVLELAGFTENDFLGTWHSVEEPLDSLMFKELEAFLHHEVDFSDESGGYCDHQLLFDSINETLVDIYETSFTYFLRTFSFSGRTRPMPRGHRVLEEVWKSMRWHMRSTLEQDQSLDDIVARDMAKGDGWMNLKLEAEYVALELEDLIVDQLLDEICL